MTDENELGMLYESFVLNEGLVNRIGAILRDGLDRGLDIYDIVKANLTEFVMVAGIFSSFATMQAVNTMYQRHPELVQKQNQYTDKVVHDIGQFLSDNPKILNILLKK